MGGASVVLVGFFIAIEVEAIVCVVDTFGLAVVYLCSNGEVEGSRICRKKEKAAEEKERGNSAAKKEGERERGVRSKEKMPSKKKEPPKSRRRRERKRALRR